MKNQLSALIDGEFDVASVEHLITSAKLGGELKQCWMQYHLIGDVMRGESYMRQDFSARLMVELENEPIIFRPNLATNITSNVGTSFGAPSRLSSIQAQYAKNSKVWSIAASVAAVMFVGVMVLQINQPEQLAPMEIAQSVPMEYLQAHQAAAPNGSAYYIQNASFSEQQPK